MNAAQPVVTIKPLYLDREAAALFLSISTTTFENLVARGEAPKPRQVSPARVGWLVEELEAYGRTRPLANMLPPPNSGHGRAGKPTGAAPSAAGRRRRDSPTAA